MATSPLTLPSQVVSFLGENRHVRVQMVAGKRKSKAPWIGERVERFLGVSCGVSVAKWYDVLWGSG